MKKITVVFLLMCISSFIVAQSSDQSFQAGWYIIQKGANYGVILPSYADVSQGGKSLKDVDVNELSMGVGEVVIGFNQRAGKTYCFDPLGRMLVFTNGLKKAPITNVSGVGHIIRDIEILSGEDLKAGLFVWIVGQDISKNTITVMVAGEKTYEIPRASVELITKTFQNMAKEDIQYKEALN